MMMTGRWGYLAAMAVAAGGSVLAADMQDGLIVDRNRADRRAPTVAEATPPATIPATPPTVEPFVVQSVVLEGSSLPQERIDAVAAPFVGQTLDVQGLARLQQAMSAAVAQGTAALPFVTFTDGDFRQGVVRFTALEARVGRVAIYGDVDGGVDLMRHYAARLAGEAPLSRKTAERYFSLIADIPGTKTTLKTVPSATPGAIDLGLEVERTRWDYAFGLNTRGSRTLGRTQLQATATLNGAFRMGDQTTFQLLVPTDLERFQYVSASHRSALGHDGASVTGSLGYLRTRPRGSPLKGEAKTAALLFSWPAIRSYQTNLVLSGGLDGLDSANAAFGEQIASERTRVLRASAAWSRATPRQVVTVSGSVSRGLEGLGARSAAPGLTDIAFTKVNARADISRAVGRSWRFSGSAAGQQTDDRAPVTERFTLGGADFGRGFTSALVSGDSGYGAKVEAAWRPAALPAPVRGSELYAFADGGEVRINDRPGLPAQNLRLASAGGGARVAIRDRTVVEIEGARSLDDPRPGQEDSWRLSVGVATRF